MVPLQSVQRVTAVDTWILEEKWPGESDESLYTRLARADADLIESWAEALAEREEAVHWIRASEKERERWRSEVRKRLDNHLVRLRGGIPR